PPSTPAGVTGSANGSHVLVHDGMVIIHDGNLEVQHGGVQINEFGSHGDVIHQSGSHNVGVLHVQPARGTPSDAPPGAARSGGTEAQGVRVTTIQHVDHSGGSNVQWAPGSTMTVERSGAGAPVRGGSAPTSNAAAGKAATEGVAPPIERIREVRP